MKLLTVVFFLATLVAFGQTTPVAKKTSVGIVLTSSGPGADLVTPEDMIYGKMKSDLYVFIRDPFDKPLTMEAFAQMYKGEKELVRKKLAETSLRMILLGRITYKFGPLKIAGESGFTCDMAFSYKMLNAGGDTIEDDTVIVAGAGFSETSSIETAVRHLIQMLGPSLGTIPLR